MKFRRYINIFTDGSCWPTTKGPLAKGGYAVIIDTKEYKEILYGALDTSKHYASALRAEGTAIDEALKFIITNPDQFYHANVQIFSDCKFWINLLHIQKSKTDMDITQRLLWRWHTIQKMPLHLGIQHVMAHNRSWRNSADPFKRYQYLNNEIADRFARLAREQTEFTKTMY